jgi:hypothetical protein
VQLQKVAQVKGELYQQRYRKVLVRRRHLKLEDSDAQETEWDNDETEGDVGHAIALPLVSMRLKLGY